GGSTGSPAAGTGGAGTMGAGSGGSNAGTGGAGTGGSGTSGAGTGGTNSGGGCLPATGASALISDFSDGNVSHQQTGSAVDVWTAYPGGTAAVVTGALHLSTPLGSHWSSATTVIGATGPNAVSCVNVSSKYLGISLKIRSSTNTELVFVVTTPETSLDDSHFRKVIGVVSSLSSVQIPFVDLVRAPFGVGQALPNDYRPAQHMTGLGFGVANETEPFDVTIDDVTFY